MALHNGQDDTEVALARAMVQIAHLEENVRRIEAEYVKLARYLSVERAVFGLIAMVAVVLIGIAVTKLFGTHP